MKRLVGSVVAVLLVAGFARTSQAADLPAQVVAANWSGAYVGVNAGYGQSNKSARWNGEISGVNAVSFLLNAAFGVSTFDITERPHYQDLDQRGFVGGALVGYNLRVGKSWLASIEADLQYADFKSSAANSGPDIVGITVTATSKHELRAFGTLRARAGVLSPDERFLAYVTGGLAYGVSKLSAQIDRPSAGQLVVNANAGGSTLVCITGGGSIPCLSGNDTSLRLGWAAGAGLEWLMYASARLRLEYMHVDLGQHLLAVAPTVAGTSFAQVRVNTAFDVVRAGLLWGF